MMVSALGANVVFGLGAASCFAWLEDPLYVSVSVARTLQTMFSASFWPKYTLLGFIYPKNVDGVKLALYQSIHQPMED